MKRSAHPWLAFLATWMLTAASGGCDLLDANNDLDRYGGREGQRWVTGDLHVHTSSTAAGTTASTVTAVIELAAQQGLDFLALTDQSSSVGSLHQCPAAALALSCDNAPPNRCTCLQDPLVPVNVGPEFPFAGLATAQAAERDMVAWEGVEIDPLGHVDTNSGDVTQETGNILCLPFDDTMIRTGPIADRPAGEHSGNSALTQCRIRHGFAAVAHPYADEIGDRFDWSTADLPALQIYHGQRQWDVTDEAALAAWSCAISMAKTRLAQIDAENEGEAPQTTAACAVPRRRWMLPIAGSGTFDVKATPLTTTLSAVADAAALSSPAALGAARTSVLTPTTEPTQLRDALCAGQVVLHDGQTAFVDFKTYDDDGAYIGTIGSDLVLTNDDPILMRVRARAEVESRAYLMFVPELGCRTVLDLDARDVYVASEYFSPMTADAAMVRYARTMDLVEARTVCRFGGPCEDEWVTTLETPDAGYYFWRLIPYASEQQAEADAITRGLNPSDFRARARVRRPINGVAVTNAMRITLE